MFLDKSINVKNFFNFCKILNLNEQTKKDLIEHLNYGTNKYGAEAYKKNDLIKEFFTEFLSQLGYLFLMSENEILTDIEAKSQALKIVINWEEIARFFFKKFPERPKCEIEQKQKCKDCE